MCIRDRSTGKVATEMQAVVGGLLVWLVPFVVSCFLITPDGHKAIDLDWFRIVMISVASLTAACATAKCNPQTQREGVALAVKFLLMNWGLDLIVLVPLMVHEATGQPLSVQTWMATVPYWFRKVGGAYVAFVAMCAVAGRSAEQATLAAAKKR
eukprot:TRINITY_DN22115_c0_g1_i1.p1 TRINITY_DN22115_c0_g1~~TRINITY_DN22115_c0_g1_i1.p1  ORF type:complete len:154 (-),score=40.12 TRINITY_DN22115_c0_g1_i1:201-662(-)